LIILNRDKEIVTVENWGDIVSRPGFTGSLNPSAHELESIIGRYAFRDYIPCGLSNCHTPHGKGYIVVTKDGRETNIGKDCGKKYFGVDFETLSSQFDRAVTEKENREKVWNFFFRIDEVQDQVKNLRGGDRGADWVYKTSTPLTSAGKDVPSAVVRRISAMVKTGETILTVEREANEDEIKAQERQTQRSVKRPFYVSVPVAEVAGLDALYAENNLKELLVIKVAEPLKDLERLDIDSLDFNALKSWARWIGEVEGNLDRAAAAIEKGRRLLTRANLEPFGTAASLDVDSWAQFNRFLEQLPNA
jgi:hypothetical protein